MDETKQALLCMPCKACSSEKPELVKEAPLTLWEMWVEQDKKREELVKVQQLIEDMDLDIKWKNWERWRLADEEKLMKESLEYGKLVREAENTAETEEAQKNLVW